MTINFLPDLIYSFFLIFGRVGVMMMILPALGETMVPQRLRLVFALSVSIVLYPVVSNALPALPATLSGIIWLLISEMIVGAAIGLTIRLSMSALQVAGTAIAFQTGLAFAQNVDPTQGTQSAIFATFMSMTAVTLIFLTDLHHLMLGAVGESYTLFRPGNILPIGDFSETAVTTVARSFTVAIKIAAPFLAFGLIFYAGIGVLSRLMPQVQIFFVVMPLNIWIGFVLFALLLGAGITLFLAHFKSIVLMFVGG